MLRTPATRRAQRPRRVSPRVRRARALQSRPPMLVRGARGHSSTEYVTLVAALAAAALAVNSGLGGAADEVFGGGSDALDRSDRSAAGAASDLAYGANRPDRPTDEPVGAPP